MSCFLSYVEYKEKRERQENRKETIREVERDLGMGEGG
jgi:hypothetical protein